MAGRRPLPLLRRTVDGTRRGDEAAPTTRPRIHPADHLLLLAAAGHHMPDELVASLGAGAPGASVFRGPVDAGAALFAEGVAALWRAVGDGPPPLVAVDQEGGQLEAVAAVTPFPGNLALGAADDPTLTEAVGRAIGTELRALGCTLDYAPVVDLATTPTSPTAGLRTFGDDPTRVGAHAAAFVRGLQSAGVAGCAKHFPGIGDADGDTHHGLASVPHARERFEAVELVPFRAVVDAGVKAVMTGHAALPGLTGDRTLPGSLAADTTAMLRRSLGFEGVVVTDALDMASLHQSGPAAVVDLVAAVLAGNDLLLTTPGREQVERVRGALRAAVDRSVIPAGRVTEATSRVGALRRWLADFPQPPVDVVGARDHRDLAAEVARRSIALVRDGRTLPIPSDVVVLVVEVEPTAATPADTSAWRPAGTLASALRARRERVRSMVVAVDPLPDAVAAVVAAARDADVVIVATADAHVHGGQAALATAVLSAAVDVVTVATRTPWDLLAYPTTRVHLATHSPQAAAMDAVAAVLCGEAVATGRTPVAGLA